MTPLLAKRRREALELVRAGAPDYLAKPFEPS
jgi:DNA-binding response OmpR family regulator